jgi:hypothetical protein
MCTLRLAMPHARLLLVVVLALTALVRWESNATQIRTSDRIGFFARTRTNCFNLNTLRGGGEKLSTRYKQSEPAADAPSPPSDSEASNDGPTEKPADSLAQMDEAPEEEERFSYMKVAEKEVRDAEVKEAKRNKEVDEYYQKRERGEIKLPEEQVLAEPVVVAELFSLVCLRSVSLAFSDAVKMRSCLTSDSLHRMTRRRCATRCDGETMRSQAAGPAAPRPRRLVAAQAAGVLARKPETDIDVMRRCNKLIRGCNTERNNKIRGQAHMHICPVLSAQCGLNLASAIWARCAVAKSRRHDPYHRIPHRPVLSSPSSFRPLAS